MTITIYKPRLFAAAARFTSTDYARRYLHGVSIEAAHAGGAYIVSTDGHRLFVGYDPDADMGGAESALIQPATRKFPAGRYKIDGKLVLGDDQAQWYRDPDGDKPDEIEISPELRDETFPDWTRLIPRDLRSEGVPAQFNATHLWEFAEAHRLLAGHKSAFCAPVRHDGHNAALVDLGPDAFGILMPIRADARTSPPFDINHKA